MKENLAKIAALLGSVQNPGKAILDRLKLQRSAYTLRLKSGPSMELRPDSGDLFGFYEIMLRQDYFTAGQVIRPGNTVIDVGANIGCFSVIAAARVGTTGRVLAFEPEQSTHIQLRKNIALNKLEHVIALRQAVGGEEGEIVLHSDPNRLFSSVFSSVNGRQIKGEDQRVPVTTLEALMDKNGIRRCDYLKLDCEGAEHGIVASMTKPLALRVPQITMEVHKIPGVEGHSLSEKLQSLGYRRVGNSTLPFYRHVSVG